MFSGIMPGRLLKMSEQELRWFDNVKKAFYESDRAYTEGRAHDICMPELCKAIDTAKTLLRSLRGENASSRDDNKKRFVEFLNLELPSPESGGLQVSLVHARTGETKSYSFAGLVYDIRCMVHENENLNAAEAPDYHILLDWSQPRGYFGSVTDGRLTCNGHMLWERLRQILAKFVTGIDGMIAIARIQNGEREGTFSITSEPPLGSVRFTRTGQG